MVVFIKSSISSEKTALAAEQPTRCRRRRRKATSTVGAARDLPQRQVRDRNSVDKREARSVDLPVPARPVGGLAPPALLRRISCLSLSRWASLSSSSSAVGSPSDEELMTHRTPTGQLTCRAPNRRLAQKTYEAPLCLCLRVAVALQND